MAIGATPGLLPGLLFGRRALRLRRLFSEIYNMLLVFVLPFTAASMLAAARR